MKKIEIIGVILAAGKGERIKPISLSYPKPLIPICNKPIMLHQIEQMKSIGIRDFLIVVGHRKERILSYFGNGNNFDVKIKYVVQEKTLGIAHAVGQLENYIASPFMMFLGDIFILTRNLNKMIKEFHKKRANAVLAVKKESNPEFIKRNFLVIQDKRGIVKRVIEKPRYVVNNIKGCGVYLFDLHIFDAIRQTPRTAMRDEYEITNSIQILIDLGYKVCAQEVVDWDMNITVPKDIIECNLKLLKKNGALNSIYANAKFPKKTIIRNSTIGEKVTIKYPIKIENSVIFPGTKINKNSAIKNSVLTPYGLVSCELEV